MLTRTTAAWHGRDGIRANCIAPGHLHSAFTLHLDEEHRERRRRVVPRALREPHGTLLGLPFFLQVMNPAGFLE